MGASPLVLPVPSPVPGTGGLRAAASPLKRVPSALVSSSGGTPRQASGAVAATAAAPPTSSSSSMDLTERLNEDERTKYIRGKELGEGTYAVVYEGRLRSDPNVRVAIKKIKVQKEYSDGMAPDAVREVKFLQELRHPNIVLLLSVFSSRDQNLNLVLEHLPLGDLEMLIRDGQGVAYGAADIKAWAGMLTRAVWFCHAHFVLHRDIKPNNLLVAADGELKLADFGLARAFADPFGAGRPMTSNVVTRWYRAPELLFGAAFYAGCVDVWSVGCVLAELIMRGPYLPGNTEVEQIALVCRHVGTPTDENWPGVTKLKHYAVPDEIYPARGRDALMPQFGTVGPEGVDLLVKTLALDPRKRITAEEMLRHPWWRVDPRPTRKEDLPRKSEKVSREKSGADLKRRPGILDDDRGVRVARKLDFGTVKKK